VFSVTWRAVVVPWSSLRGWFCSGVPALLCPCPWAAGRCLWGEVASIGLGPLETRGQTKGLNSMVRPYRNGVKFSRVFPLTDSLENNPVS